MASAVMSRLNDVILLGRAAMDLFRIDLALRRYGFQHLMMTLERAETPRKTIVESTDIRRAQRYGRRIATAAHVGLPRAQCLHRSLVLHKWLRDTGYPSELRIGVRKDGNQLHAHAWVEMAGCILNDSPNALRPFTPLVSQASPDDRLKWSLTELGHLQWQ
jgi:hypothetical protein